MRGLAFVVLTAGAAFAVAPKPLSIVHAVVEKARDGAPVYSPEAFTAGEEVHFSFFLENAARKDEQVKISWSAAPKDASGAALIPELKGEQVTKLSPEDKDWRPKVRGSFQLPGILLAGRYSIAIEARDDIGKVGAAKELRFDVDGPRIETSKTFAITSLKFYRNSDLDQPLQVAAYTSGEKINAGFALVGYEHGDGGLVDVSYTARVVDSGGKVLFASPEATREKSSGFYPEPYVPASLELTLGPGTPSGEFTVRIEARDAVGGRTAYAEAKFKLE